MRLDAANVLIWMGYALDRDFVAVQDSAASVSIKWLSEAKQPAESEIDAAAPLAKAAADALAAQRALDAVEVPAAKDDLRSLMDVMQAIIDAAAQAQADMDAIITGYDTANAAQRAGMIKDLARAMKRHTADSKDIARAIRRTIRVVT